MQQNPVNSFHLLNLKREFNEFCIDQCLTFDQHSKLSRPEEVCLKNCSGKVKGYQRLAKELGIPIK